jgi:hypothetical protein
MNVTAKKDGPVWVVRVEDAGDCEPVQEYADRLLPKAFAMAERAHGAEIIDALAAKLISMPRAA